MIENGVGIPMFLIGLLLTFLFGRNPGRYGNWLDGKSFPPLASYLFNEQEVKIGYVISLIIMFSGMAITIYQEFLTEPGSI